MPIRFRCPECHQLLGIARRKAGTYVSCPTCRRDTLVPFEDQLPLEPPPAEALPDVALPPPTAPAPPPALFERDDFEDILQGVVPHPETSRSRGSAVRTPVPASRPQPPPVSRWAAPAEASQSGGLVLSPARATTLTVVVILLMALAFALGLIVGRFVL